MKTLCAVLVLLLVFSVGLVLAISLPEIREVEAIIDDK
jgi:hypothetical protein